MIETPVPAPGAQPERTRLAWRRTTLTLTVVGLLAVRLATSDGGSPVSVAAVSAIALLWAAFLAAAQIRVRRLARDGTATFAAPWPLIAVLAVLAVAALAVVLVV